ncbi:MAG: aminotransferase class V-fold PLP-dependent enzyme [Solirubrobacteraceae bacterium]|nr:aminotransferase class V-fold PLP-dependent enzyme [Solirubrobacteraceae bacterium]
MDAAALRAEFPVCEDRAYLNAGTCGPVPRASAAALREVAEHALAEGRATGYYERLIETRDRLRAAYAGVLGAQPADVAITTSTSEGIARVLLGLDLAAGDEILIAEHEHGGLIGPLIAARDRFGLSVREVPLAELPSSVGARTRLIACSHVAWTTGEVLGDLGGLPDDLPVLLDGAQGAGAVSIDAAVLGCAFYTGSGQKWMCGPVGTGMLWVSPAWRERLVAASPTYMNLEDPSLGMATRVWGDARAHDTMSLSLESAAAALAAHDTLAAFGWTEVHARGRELAAQAAAALAEAGREVAPRGPSTLVSWTSEDPVAEAARLAEAGVVVRSFGGLPYVRASIGAWNDESDVQRLVSAAAAR